MNLARSRRRCWIGRFRRAAILATSQRPPRVDVEIRELQHEIAVAAEPLAELRARDRRSVDRDRLVRKLDRPASTS